MRQKRFLRLGRGTAAVAIVTSLVGLSGALGTAAPAGATGLTEGGTFTCNATVASVSTQVFSVTMNSGTSGSTGSAAAATSSGDTITFCTLSGVIPSGWSVDVSGVPFNLGVASGNAGTISLGTLGGQASLVGTTFTNQGMLTEDTSGSPETYNLKVTDFTNTGTITSPTGRYGYVLPLDNSTASVFDNQGTIDVTTGSTFTINGSDGSTCTHGTAYQQESGASIDVQGTMTIDCGSLSFSGGSLTDTSGSGPGSITVGGESGHTTVHFGAPYPSGTQGTLIFQDSREILDGIIPSGWVVTANALLAANAGSGNAGTLNVSGFNSMNDPGSFTNSGTFDVTGDGGFDVTVPTFTNTGTVEVTQPPLSTSSEELQFLYDNATTAGTIDNQGTFNIAANQQVTAGPSNCTTGEAFASESGSSITGAGELLLQCGSFTVNGGSISSAAPVVVSPEVHEAISFAAGLPAGSGGTGDTIHIGARGVTLSGTIPSGWTVSSIANFAATDGAGNAGTIDMAGFIVFTDPGHFTNSGTFDAAGGGDATVNVADFDNTGTVEATGPNTPPTDQQLQFLYDNATTAGIIDNSGTFSTMPGESMTIGPENCTTGEAMTMETATSSIANGGTFFLQCGSFTVDGGSITSAGPISVAPINKEMVTFASGLPAGSGGGDTLDVTGTGSTIGGDIPAGWTISISGTAALATGTTNGGSITVNGFSNLNGAGSFTNTGTFDATGDGGVNVRIPVIVNSGTVEVTGTTSPTDSESLNFLYDNATTAGTIDNLGTFSTMPNQQIIIGSESCVKGESFTQEATATIDSGGTLNFQCGALNVNGGTVTASGPITLAPINFENVTFVPGLVGTGGNGDNIVLGRVGTTFDSFIPPGWTILTNGVGMSALPGMGNDGTIINTGDQPFDGISDSGMYTNAGSIIETAVNAGFVGLVTAFLNTGTISLGPATSLKFSTSTVTNSGTLDVAANANFIAENFVQTTGGTTAIGVNGTTGQVGVVSVIGSATLGGTLDLQTATQPTVGQIFQCFTWASNTGQFPHVNGAVLGGGLAYSTAYNSPSNLRLNVVTSSVLQSLAASNVAAPSTVPAVPGQTLTSSYTVTNNGTAAATGGWEDSVYLGTGLTYTEGDPLLERLPITGPLAAGASYTNGILANVPAVTQGTYHLIVVPDSSDLASSMNNDQQAISPAFNVGPIPTLTPNHLASAVLNSNGTVYFQVTVPSTNDVEIQLSAIGFPFLVNNADDAVAYASLGSIPTPQSFMLTTSPTSSFPTLVLPSTSPGVWYIAITGGPESVGDWGDVLVSTSLPGLQLNNLSPVAGSSGPVTITLQGSGFGPDLTATLSLPGAGTATATSVQVVSSTTAFATFDLSGLTPAPYNLDLSTGGHQVGVQNAFTVEPPGAPQLEVSSSGGGSLRFGFFGTAVITMTNTGTSNVDIPILRISAQQNAQIDVPGISNGFTQSVDVVNPQLTATAGGPPLQPGILPPGVTATYTYLISAFDLFGVPDVTGQIFLVDSAENTPIDWSSQLASDQPATLSPASWNTVVNDVANELGPTEGTYATALSSIISQAAADGVTFVSEGQALAWIVQQQIDSGAGAPVTGTLFFTSLSAVLPRTDITLASTDGTQTLTGTSWYDGKFSFWDVPPGTYNLMVTGFLPRVAATFNVAPAANGLSVVVAPGATLQGTITDSTASAPVQGAVVTVTDASGTVVGQPSGSDGTYSVPGLVAGPVTVTVTGPDILSSTVTTTVSLAAPTTQNFSLAEGGKITGTITALGGGIPPAGTTVSATPNDGSGSAVVGTVNGDGTFSIGGLLPEAGPPHTYDVVAAAPGTGGASQNGVTVTGTGTTSGIALSLLDTSTVSGTVVDQDSGQPIGGVTVSTDDAATPISTTTASDGTYTLSGVATGSQNLTFTPTDGGHAAGTLAISPTGGQSLTENASLAPLGTATITVEDATAAPIAGQTVQLVGPVAGGAANATSTQNAVSGGDGTATFNDLSPGTYDAQVPGSFQQATLTVGPGSRQPAAIISIAVATISGTVTDSSSNPLGSIAIAVSDPTGPIVSTTTAADGTYTVLLTAAGSYSVSAVGSSFGAATQSVTATLGSTTTANFQTGTATLAVSVTDGGPVDGATVELTAGSSASTTAPIVLQTDSTGSVSFSPLATGSYTVSAFATGDAISTQTVPVAAGANTATFPLGPEGVISGTVSDGGGPVGGANVVATSGSTRQAATTAGDGTYRIGNLPGGTYNVSISDTTDAPTTSQGVLVVPGTPSTVSPTLAAAGDTVTLAEQAATGGVYPSLSVGVLDVNGVAVQTASLGPALSGTSSTATATVGPLPAGSYTLSVSGPGLATTTQALTVPAGSPVAITPPTAEALGASAALQPNARPASNAHTVSANASAPVGAQVLVPNTIVGTFLNAISTVRSWFNVVKPTPFANLDALTSRVQTDLGRPIPSCAGPNNIPELKNELQRLFSAMNNSYSAWLNEYNNLTQTGLSDLGLILFDMLGALSSIGQAVLSVAAPETQIESWIASGSFLKAGAVTATEFQTAFNGIVGFANGGTSAVSALLSNDPTATTHNISNILQNWGNLESAVGAFKAIPGLGSTILGVVGNLEAAIGSIIAGLNDLQQFVDDAQSILGIIQQSQDTYNKSVFAVSAAAGRLEQAFNQLQIDQNCPPPPPPNPPPTPPGPNNPFTNDHGLDPNGIVGPSGFGLPNWVPGGTAFPYLIEFQNDPTATAAVAQVTVTEPVSPGLDPSSIQLTGFGFGSHMVVLPPGQQSFDQTFDGAGLNGDNVEVQGSYDQQSSTITWTMTAINPFTGDTDSAADAGFLPPDDVNTGSGEGFVSFSGAPVSGVTTGTVVNAAASIVFDRNPAINTATWTNDIDVTAPTASMTALPASTTAGMLPLSWQGDDGNGSGVAAYTVYVEQDGGALQPWLSDTTATTASYPTVAGHTYGFAVQATDNVGNAGTVPGSPQTTTTANTGSGGGTPPPPPPNSSGQGYWESGADGGVFAFGNAAFHGSTGALRLNKPVVDLAPTPDGGGYWEVASDGGVFSFGNAQYFGSMGGRHLNAPIVGLTPTANGQGYWEVASDGGIFTFGNAHFFGSTGALHLNKPIVGMAATPDGGGYWLVASDGGVFAFGDAVYHGSTGALHLNKPIVGMAATPDGGGYWLVASDGGVFTFGNATYHGSTGALHLNKPIVGVASADAGGYWLVASDGGVFAFGDARYLGSPVGSRLNAPVVGLATQPAASSG